MGFTLFLCIMWCKMPSPNKNEEYFTLLGLSRDDPLPSPLHKIPRNPVDIVADLDLGHIRLRSGSHTHIKL